MYDSEIFGFPVENSRMIVPVSSRSGSNYGFVAAHWPPRRYRANRVPLSHANSPATAVIASRRGLTSNTSWLVFSRTVGVSPLSLSPRTRRSFSRHTSLVVLLGVLLSFYIFSPLVSSPSAFRRCSVSLSLSQFLRTVAPSNEKGPAVPRGTPRSRSREHERALSTPRRALVPPPRRAHSRGDRKSTRHARFIFCPT